MNDDGVPLFVLINNKKYKNFLWGAAIIFFYGCAASTTNLSPVWPKDKPHIQTVKAPSLDNIKNKTFSVFPVSRLKREPLLKNDILEMQMLFFLRNVLEIRGYRYVKVTEKPDILATIDGHIQHKKNPVYPETLVSPKWVTGKTALKTYVPGNMPKQTYKVPRYTEGTFYPVIRIDVLDPNTFKPIWTGMGVGTANNSDLSISSQTIVIFLLDEFPKGPWSYDYIMAPFGFGFFVFTNNGNDYYPTVFTVIKNSPADKAGIKRYDMISSIDGIAVRNKPVSEIINMFQKELGKKKSVTLFRLDKQIDVEIFPRFQ
ncbi:MAG: DUF4136 domain-containing protein [Deltaproteobacteria bacterium]|nr:DUF4136 domain-containing protein [Deltaproteobacteria bacterium]MBW1912770.1 DUF4136 domain-containing protein [Deltaproteobacteria bacterium]